MVSQHVHESPHAKHQGDAPPDDSCLMVIFGASGDLTKRLLMPAIYNLACDGLLPEKFGIIGIAKDAWTTEAFRDRMTEDIKKFSTRATFDAGVWEQLVQKMQYTPGVFDDPAAYRKLAELIAQREAVLQTGGNVLFYLAVPPVIFGMISDNLEKAGFQKPAQGWRRIIVEKPFGHDLASAIALNREILKYWREEQVYRIDHYLGKETVQNILAFRFANGIFESLWNKNSIDHIQLTVSESVGVEGRGGYYDHSGVLRDMIQNHMFQILAYLCMEPPASFQADAIRNEKVKLLQSVRIMSRAEVEQCVVRGQYGAGQKADGAKLAGYREEPDVPPTSATETYAAMKLSLDNWRWQGVPVYLRSGKSLWKRGTELVVQFKKAPEFLFRGTPVDHLDGNQLIFHVQPDQGIELRFQAKVPGPALRLQDVTMRFAYSEAFRASRGTGYEVLLHSCMSGDATLFSRTDLVEAAWRIAQPLLDAWQEPPREFPNYPAASWGPRAAFDLIERDGRKWVEIINRDFLETIPLFHGCDPVFLNALVMLLKPVVCSAGDTIFREGGTGAEMYILCRGEVDVIKEGQTLATLKEGSFFGEISLLLEVPRTATVQARTYAELFVLQKADFSRALSDYPEFGKTILEVAKGRYNLQEGQLLGS